MSSPKPYFDPKTNKYPYPEYTDKHYLEIKKDNGFVFDKDYPYFDNSKKYRFKRKRNKLILRTMVFPLTRMYMGLKIKGKKNLKNYKVELSNGFVSVSNHVHLWDYIAIMKALKKYMMNVLVWAPNLRGKDRKMVYSVGGIPIPDSTMSASIAFQKGVEDLLNHKGHVQIYAEGSMWEFYAPIRPFKTGAAYFAIKCHKPILPIGFSYRKPGLIAKMFHRPADITLTIGKPLYPNTKLEGKEQEIELTKRLHAEICQLSNIKPEDNIYPDLFDNSKKIIYY